VQSLHARARAGAAVVVVSHRVDAVVDADAVYRMRHGRLEVGPPIPEGGTS
jgi:ABC-type transport system involved in cytochrome bd biosynthesis fused ATPase/permease subunit